LRKHARGIEVALVTGRRYELAHAHALQIGAPLTMIVSNGAIIRTQDGETHLRIAARDTAAACLKSPALARQRRRHFRSATRNQVDLETFATDDPIRHRILRAQ